MKLKLAANEEIKEVLEKKIETVLTDLKSDDIEGLKNRIAELEEENVKMVNSTSEIKLEKSQLETQLAAYEQKIEELNKRIASQKKLQGRVLNTFLRSFLKKLKISSKF